MSVITVKAMQLTKGVVPKKKKKKPIKEKPWKVEENDSSRLLDANASLHNIR